VSFLVIDNVTYSYNQEKGVITDTTCQINEGEFHSLVGRSGCGKTTLLKIASGLLQPGQGAVYFKGEKVLQPRADVGFVFQAPTLLEWKKVIDNVLLPISLHRKPTKEEKNRALSLLELMRLTEYQHDYPTELSGGQQSRVAIARALIKNPSMLFLDEPFAALDAITREELQEDFLRLCQLHKTTVLFITHDISEAVYMSDHVVVMEKGQIINHLKIELPNPRTIQTKYSAAFNELCLKIRHAMNGGEHEKAL
jgi:NitT/TauT family transport system ATP-binding protein